MLYNLFSIAEYSNFKFVYFVGKQIAPKDKTTVLIRKAS